VALSPDYITVAEAAAYLRIDDTVDDAELGLWVTAASRLIDSRCNRQFGQAAAPVARTYRNLPFYSPAYGLWLLEIDDVQTTTGLLVNGVAYASSGAILLPDDAPDYSVPWTTLGFPVQPTDAYPGAPAPYVITLRPGWTAIPNQVKAACKLQVKFWSDLRDKGGDVQTGMTRLEKGVAQSLAGLARRRPVG
jgi:hypothetical protein